MVDERVRPEVAGKDKPAGTAQPVKPADMTPGTAVPPTSPQQKPGARGTSRVVWGIAISVVAVVVLAFAVIVFGFYRLGWRDSFSSQVVKTLRLPVAFIGSQSISYSSFQGDLDTLDTFYKAQEAQNPGSITLPSDSYLQKSVLSRMIREQFIADQAARFNITLTQQEVDGEFDKVVAQASGIDEVRSVLKQLYNWTDAEFKAKVLTPFLLRNKLQEYLSADQALNADAKKRATEVLAKVQEGKISFEDLAKQYSEDTTSANGGDLGFFSKGQMVKAFEDAALALKPGEVSGIVQSQYGYHIIKLTEHPEVQEGKAEQWRASHILIKTKDVDEWTKEQLAQKRIIILTKGLVWQSDCGLVLGSAETCDNNELNAQASTATDTSAGTPAETNTNTAANTNTENTNTAAGQ